MSELVARLDYNYDSTYLLDSIMISQGLITLNQSSVNQNKGLQPFFQI